MAKSLPLWGLKAATICTAGSVRLYVAGNLLEYPDFVQELPKYGLTESGPFLLEQSATACLGGSI